MSVAGSRVAIIGGSIAGCAAAIALTRAGCDVTVFERTRGTLQDRGFGIGIPPGLLGTLVAEDYVDATMPAVPGRERVFIVRDSGNPDGRVVWRQPLPLRFVSWSLLWQALRRRLADDGYRDGTQGVVVDAEETGATVRAGAAGTARFDLVLGADGYASAVRHLIAPESTLSLSGYGLWRGTYPDDLLPDGATRELVDSVIMICFPGGHSLFYLIPDHARPGHRLINWGIYITPPRPFSGPGLIQPGRVPPDLMDVMRRAVTENFPRRWADIVEHIPAERISVQPIFDLTTSRYVAERLALAGDAGTTARPHTGAGASKALQDALALESGARAFSDWPSILEGYDRVRCAAGNALTAFGRSLGRATVENTPSWDRMSHEDFANWWQNTAQRRRSVSE